MTERQNSHLLQFVTYRNLRSSCILRRPQNLTLLFGVQSKWNILYYFWGSFQNMPVIYVTNCRMWEFCLSIIICDKRKINVLVRCFCQTGTSNQNALCRSFRAYNFLTYNLNDFIDAYFRPRLFIHSIPNF
jgi:hypothetical protein